MATLEQIDTKVDTLALGSRASLAEVRASLAEQRLRDADFRTDVLARLDTIVGAIADLRSEYQNHTHDQ